MGKKWTGFEQEFTQNSLERKWVKSVGELFLTFIA